MGSYLITINNECIHIILYTLIVITCYIYSSMVLITILPNRHSNGLTYYGTTINRYYYLLFIINVRAVKEPIIYNILYIIIL